MSVQRRILLDTDIGTDIDDAVCLAYLLAQMQRGECVIEGITTVSGSPVDRAKLVSALCIAAGFPDIPIYPGAPLPLLEQSRDLTCPQAAVLDRLEHKKDFPLHQHIQFMIDTIRANPGEITLLAIGPLTNVALLFATDPEIPGLLKELVLMCGRFTSPVKEWNAYLDSYAAAMVYKAMASQHRSIGLDVTTKVTMKSEEVLTHFHHPLLQVVLTIAEVWFRKRDIITFHDPLAATTLFSNDICSFKRGTVDVELLSQRVKGITYWTPDEEHGRHEVAWTVDSGRFFEHFFGVFEDTLK